MASRNLAFALVGLISAVSASPVFAQEADDDAPPNIPTLSQRLEQFRNELVGEPGAAENQEAAEQAAKRQKLMASQKRRGAAPSQAPAATPLPQSQGVPTPAAQVAKAPTQSVPMQPGSTVRTPSRMEVQSARRAQPSRGLIPSKTPPERTVPGEDESPAPSRVDIDENELEEPVDEPRVARALPSQESPRELPAEVEESEAPATSGVLFTTQSPVLSVEAIGPRTVMIGKEAKFVVKIRNAGAAANNVVVSMNIPEGVEVAQAHATAGTVPTTAAGQPQGPMEWKINRMEGKSGEMLNLVLVPRKSTPLDLAIRWTFTPEASQVLVEVREPKLEMTLSGPEDVMYGETKIYKLTLSNPGNGDSENVVIGLLPVGRAGDGIASHKVGTLHAGESKTINVELTARQAGTITIKAQAYADGGLRTEAVEQVLVRRASLQINVEAPKVKYAGTVGTYKVKVVNAGNAVAEDVEVSAMLPPDAKYIGSGSGGRFDAQQGKVAWSAGTLQPAAERVFDMQCTLATPGDNRLQFVAAARDNLSSSATSNTQVQALADLKIEVRDPQGPIAVGEASMYEIVVRNRGSAAAEHVDLALFFSEGLEATKVEGPEHELAAGQVVFKPLAAVGAGETVVFKVHTKADRGGNHVFRAELVCRSLGTKLAAEEATLYYGDDASAAQSPTPAAAPAETAAQGEPTLATPTEAAPADEPPPVPQ